MLGVFFLKKYYVAELEQKYISAFINDIFCGNLDNKQIEDKAKGYGWNKNDVFLTVSIQLEATRNASKIPKALLEIAQLIPRDNYYLCIQEDCLHILYKTTNEENIPDRYTTISEIIITLEQYITKTYSFFSFYAGISSIVSDTAQISQIVRESADALQFGHTFKNPVVKYDDLGALRMLASSSHQENMKQIIPPAIWKLAEYDKVNNTQYLDTLDSLLGNNLNLSKTAKELFIHYKTMLHRMERINQIAEISLDDRNVRLDIELGVKLYMMLPK